ncbi:hypothetical protein FJQ98_14500 [Lysinibacillus agricola]|uniref:Uncharacterized protein n=1 Tax=Lysinibacillus agricola TaxID=2590012 RepID=A0ABX7AKX9_9BACI|nr:MULTISPECIES: hypothetical protein [Lysinibacillus]KOS64692.1 hypothetical protein AN161_01345 [Lysinibacillus sp. FJAT-14222]QQP10493.1 hypothetical protein FJQ98_14500 [Lysinibacillus agricola]
MDLLKAFASGGLSVLYIILPVIILMAVEIGCIVVFSSIFEKLLPNKIYKSLLVCVALVIFYIWAVPMDLGFLNFFRAMF